MKSIVFVLIFLMLSLSSHGQIDSVKWYKYLDAAFKGSHDVNTNKNTKISSKNGACKITFMNIQKRMNDGRINPNDIQTQRIALDMTQMENAFDESTKRSNYTLINPTYRGQKITLKTYLKFNNKDSIDIGVVTHIKQLIKSDSLTDGYYAYAFGVAAGFHLFHLLVHKKPEKIEWYLFDDFGINGEIKNLQNIENYDDFIMTETQVSDYLKKFMKHAVFIYKSSPNIKKPTKVEGENWNAFDRPLWTKFYVIEE